MVAPFEIFRPISGSNILFDEDMINVASFQGLDGVIGSRLVTKLWNQKETMGSQEILHQYWNFLVQAKDAPAVRSLHCSQDLLSTAIFKPCNLPLSFYQREREGRCRRRWWWRWWLEEVIKAKECGPKTGDVNVQKESENLPNSPNPSAPWLCCHIFQVIPLRMNHKLSWHIQINSCSLDSPLRSILSNTSPAYPSNSPPLPKGSAPMAIRT